MVTDEQVRRLYMLQKRERSIAVASVKSGMSEKTGRKYVKLNKLPSQCAKPHTWRTREDPFADVWAESEKYLRGNPNLEAKFLFEYLQEQNPGKFQDGQLRTFQRRVKVWRALEGSNKEVYFPQEHIPGRLCESDFTDMRKLGITIAKEPFPHLLYHFVLTFSNWEAGTVCFSESYESFSEGLQNALWKLGGVPDGHRTDKLSAAVHKECNRAQFTLRYEGLLRHYGMQGLSTQVAKAHEKGDVEQRHYRIKKAVEQHLILRGSRDFESRRAYNDFLNGLFHRLNANRQKRLEEELKLLKPLPSRRLDDCKKFRVKVGINSTIRVLHNTYSVNSRLMGEEVEIQAYAEELEIWYAQRRIEKIPRLRGESQHFIQYRHIIDWLIRKPGAFAQYKYRQDLFPSTIFRIAYDQLRKQNPENADKCYLNLLYIAAKESESGVIKALQELFNTGQPINIENVQEHMNRDKTVPSIPTVQIPEVDLSVYDTFLTDKETALCRP